MVACCWSYGEKTQEQVTKHSGQQVADYIVHGVQNVRATIDDVPDEQVQQKLMKVNLYFYTIVLYRIVLTYLCFMYIIILTHCRFRMQTQWKSYKS